MSWIFSEMYIDRWMHHSVTSCSLDLWWKQLGSCSDLWNMHDLNLIIWEPTALTHWGRDKIDAILQTAFSNTISWMKMFEFRLKFHWSLFLKVQLTNIPALVQIMAWRRTGDKPLSEPMMTMYIWVTRPQWVNLTLLSLEFAVRAFKPSSISIIRFD